MSVAGEISPRPQPPIGRAAAFRIVASVLVVSAAIAGLLYQSTKEGAEYYKHVDEVMIDADRWQGKRLKVHGYVVDGSIELRKGTLDYRFKLETRTPRKAAIIEAEYRGLVPDTFKSGAEVVASGKLTAASQLRVSPDGIMAKCPSKYEAKPGDPELAKKPSTPPI